jgi:hypothetical protein
MQALCLSYNRPFHFWLTLSSLRLSLGDDYLPYSNIIIFDQSSKFLTRITLNLFAKKGCVVIMSKNNVGMLEGWKQLITKSSSDTVLLIENDWFCNTNNAIWVQDAASILDRSDKASLVKLRRIDDIDNYGKNLPDHQPWTIPVHHRQSGLSATRPCFDVEVSNSGSEVYLVGSTNTGFTFNPILIRRKKFLELITGTEDDENDVTPLRSGENVIDQRWRSNVENVAAVIDGPFSHVGFHNPLNYLWPFPAYIFMFFCRTLRQSLRRRRKSFRSNFSK